MWTRIVEFGFGRGRIGIEIGIALVLVGYKFLRRRASGGRRTEEDFQVGRARRDRGRDGVRVGDQGEFGD